MGETTEQALAILGSHDFFGHLRQSLRQVGLGQEVKCGLAAYLMAISPLTGRPLRWCLREKSKNGMLYVARKISKLLTPGTVGQIKNEKGWQSFKNNPNGKIFLATEWKMTPPADPKVSVELVGDTLYRKRTIWEDGRETVDTESVSGSFACISEHLPEDKNSRARWLTSYLKIPKTVGNQNNSENTQTFLVWQEIHRLLRQRGQLQVVLPDFQDIFIERVMRDERIRDHIVAFLVTWRTVALIRSFQNGRLGKSKDGLVRADFHDLAIAIYILRNSFYQGRHLPVPQRFFDKIGVVAPDISLTNPITGSGLRLRRIPPQKEWGSLFETVSNPG